GETASTRSYAAHGALPACCLRSWPSGGGFRPSDGARTPTCAMLGRWQACSRPATSGSDLADCVFRLPPKVAREVRVRAPLLPASLAIVLLCLAPWAGSGLSQPTPGCAPPATGPPVTGGAPTHEIAA